MSDQVLMVHPDLPETEEKPTTVSAVSFENVWKGRGWKLASKKKVQPDNGGDE